LALANRKFEHRDSISRFVSDFDIWISDLYSAPLAQLAEQVTLNCGRSEVIRPTLPNTLRNFGRRTTNTRYKSTIMLRVEERSPRQQSRKWACLACRKVKSRFVQVSFLVLRPQPRRIRELICNSKRAFCAVFQDVAQRVFQSWPEA